MYIPPPHHRTHDGVDILSATFLFSVICVNNPGRFGRNVDKTSNWAAAVSALGILILKCEKQVAFLSVGQLAQHFTLASVITRLLMPRALSTTRYTYKFSGSQGSANNNLFISQQIYNKEMVSVVSLDFILPRHTSGTSPSLSVIIV